MKKSSLYTELRELLNKTNVELSEDDKDKIVMSFYPYLEKSNIQSYQLGKDSVGFIRKSY